MKKHKSSKTKALGIKPTSQVDDQRFQRGEIYALILAIDQYEYYDHLDFCVKEAKQFIELLSTKYGFKKDAEHLIFLENEAAKKEGILQSFDHYRQLFKNKPSNQDCLIIFYSGHGDRNQVQGQYIAQYEDGFWVPSNGRLDNRNSLLTTATIKQELSSIDCMHLLLIVDACYSGTLFTSPKSSRLATAPDRPSRWGLVASQNDQLAWEQSQGSIFMAALLEVLSNNEQILGVQKLGVEIKQMVSSLSNTKQQPLSKALDLGKDFLGEYYFVPASQELKALAYNELVAPRKLASRSKQSYSLKVLVLLIPLCLATIFYIRHIQSTSNKDATLSAFDLQRKPLTKTVPSLPEDDTIVHQTRPQISRYLDGNQKVDLAVLVISQDHQMDRTLAKELITHLFNQENIQVSTTVFLPPFFKEKRTNELIAGDLSSPLIKQLSSYTDKIAILMWHEHPPQISTGKERQVENSQESIYEIQIDFRYLEFKTAPFILQLDDQNKVVDAKYNESEARACAKKKLWKRLKAESTFL
ncbi:MAG: caspase family protein [Bacteroidota bacterium]